MPTITMFPGWIRPNSFGVEFMGKAFNITVSFILACKSKDFLKTWGLYFFGQSCIVTLYKNTHHEPELPTFLQILNSHTHTQKILQLN
jgi:hypothetical protein